MMRAAAVILLAIGAGLGWVFHERYWQWRGCFNDQGRCWDPVGEQVLVEAAGWVWGVPAAVFLVAGVLMLVLARRQA